MIWKVPKIWPDSTCYIMGGGSSVLYQFGIPEELIKKVRNNELHPSVYSSYMKELHNKHIIGVNCAYMLGSWIDVLFFGDSGFFSNYGKDIALTFPNLRCTCSLVDKNNIIGVKFLKKDPNKKYGISNNPSYICWNTNSGAAAINLAVHFGAKRIVLLGFDMNLDTQNRQHWHNKYATELKKVHYIFATHSKSFPIIATEAKHLGVEILNANPNSAINDFVKVSLQDVL